VARKERTCYGLVVRERRRRNMRSDTREDVRMIRAWIEVTLGTVVIAAVWTATYFLTR
jgi:hypothetical protein